MKNFFFTFLLISILSISLTLYSQTVSEEWVARYNGTGNGWDYANSLAVDDSGYVYVTGYSAGSGMGDDYATIKYNSSGAVQWIARYSGPGNSIDWGNSVAVDGSGNVYVTGHSIGSGTDYDYATIKYNSSGVEQWVARYNGPGNGTDYARSLAVDGLGNVYVTGRSEGSESGFDYATIKYNSSGVKQWIARYNGPGNGSDWAYSLTVDDLGNIYVTGTSEGIGTGFDYSTIKYNSDGVQQWVSRYNGPGNGSDGATSLAIDGLGNVYVTGWSEDIGASRNYATIKYNSDGIQQWVERYNGPENGWGLANSLALDGSGNVYVTGWSEGSGTSRAYATLKYNTEGVQQWVSRYYGPINSWNIATSIAIDSSGYVYVTGYSEGSGTNWDYATIKYNPDGVQQWVIRYNGPGNRSDFATSLAIDGIGNVYVTGSSQGSESSYDYATIKYSQTIGITPISNEIPEQFSLYQNFPNPFNPTTTISFDIPKQSNVKLTIYDALGREVAVLVNENLSAGSYNYQFSSDKYQLTSGVYYYRLVVDSDGETGGFIETKRAVLIK